MSDSPCRCHASDHAGRSVPIPHPDANPRPHPGLRAVERVTRGPVGVALSVGFLLAGGALGGRAGLLVSSPWILLLGLYCLANFATCREAHCVVTGPGWTALGLAGFAAALLPVPAPARWQDGQVLAFLVVLGLGYAVEHRVLVRSGRRHLR